MIYTSLSQIEENLKEIEEWLSEDANLKSALEAEVGALDEIRVIWLVYGGDDIVRGFFVKKDNLFFFEKNYESKDLLLMVPIDWNSKYVVNFIQNIGLVRGMLSGK